MVNSELRLDTIGLLFVVCVCFKDHCYIDNSKTKTIDALKRNTREAIDDKIGNVLKNYTDLVGYCMAIQGSYLNEIIFHYQNKKRNFEKILSSIFFFLLKNFQKKSYINLELAERSRNVMEYMFHYSIRK